MAHNWPTSRKYWSSLRACAAAACTISSIGVLRVRGRLSASSASANSLPGSAVAMESPHPAGRVNAVNELGPLQGLDSATVEIHAPDPKADIEQVRIEKKLYT